MGAVKAGDLLISHVQVADDRFDQTVILVLDSDETGTLGVVLNRISEVELASVLPDWADQVCEPRDLFDGGPVSPNGAICLASLAGDEEPPGWRRVFSDVGLLHLDTPIELVAGAYASLRIFAGYAGWDPSQLEVELARGWWFVAEARYDDVFGAAPEGLWRSVLRRQNPEVAVYSTWTDDPEAN
ncbi:YqgE/AlgH family protein [Mariniluteicoccus flavus]